MKKDNLREGSQSESAQITIKKKYSKPMILSQEPLEIVAAACGGNPALDKDVPAPGVCSISAS